MELESFNSVMVTIYDFQGEKYSFNLDEYLVINEWLCGYFVIWIYLENVDLWELVLFCY